MRFSDSADVVSANTLMEWCCNVAVAMIAADEGMLAVGTVERLFPAPGRPGCDASRLLECVPCRVEAGDDDAATVGFEHKSIAEFLVAQALRGERGPQLLRSIPRCFSRPTPAVVWWFHEACQHTDSSAVRGLFA